MFYDDDSADAPVPWWFNSVTGESTWECPVASMISTSSTDDTKAYEYESKPAHEQQELAVVESIANVGWMQLWSEEHQVQS